MEPINTFLSQVSDLREGDLLSDAESSHCSFVGLRDEGYGWEAWSSARQLVSPVVLPAFFYAGQVWIGSSHLWI